MNPFEMVVAIVVVVMIARVLRDRYRAQATMPPPGALADDDVRRMAEELARLRERVQVLERVITDGLQTSDLDLQIDRLRDR